MGLRPARVVRPARSGMLKGVTDPLQHGAFEPGWQSAPPGYPPPYPQYPGPGSYFDPFAPYGRHPVTGQPFSDKSKTVAGLLQLLGLFGIAGIGRIYLAIPAWASRSCWWAG